MRTTSVRHQDNNNNKMAIHHMKDVVIRRMNGMFDDEQGTELTAMNEEMVAVEVQQIVEAQFIDEDDFDAFNGGDFCRSRIDYLEIEEYYVRHEKFKGYLSMDKTINQVVYLVACELQEVFLRELCEVIKNLKKQEFEDTSSLPTELNALIVGFL